MNFNKHTREFETNQRVDAFLEDLMRLYDKHKLVISHEDGHGAFIITNRHKRHAVAAMANATFDIEHTDHAQITIG